MPPATTFTWLHWDLVELLAWLNYSRHIGIKFEDTVPDHLTQCRRRRGDEPTQFTRALAHNRMSSLCRQSNKEVSVSAVYEAGSAYFTHLSTEMKRDIKIATDRLINDSSPHKLRSGLEGARKNATSSREYASSHTADVDMADAMGDQSYLHTAKLDGLPLDDNLNKHDTTPNYPSSSAATLSDSDRHALELKSRDAELAMIRQQWQDEANKLRDQLEKKTEIEIGLRVELHTKEVARAERIMAGNDRLEDKISDMRTNAYLLTKQVQDLRKQVNFVSKATQYVVADMKREISNTMDSISSEIESILHGHDLAQRLRVPASIPSLSDLGMLIRCLMGVGSSNAGEELNQLRKWVSKYDSEALVRSFVVAAVREWVFFSKFPNFLPARIRLLNAYRKAVLMHDGWKGLHNLENIAYHTLIESPDFQEGTIPKNAMEVAIRLSKALSPLFPISNNFKSNAAFPTWGEDDDVCKNRRYRLIGIFERALKLKASTVLTDMQYEFLVFPPGSKAEHMNSISTTQAAEDPSLSPHAKIDDTSLLATIHMYGDVHRDDSLDSALLHSSNFVSKTKTERLESSRYKNDLIVGNASFKSSRKLYPNRGLDTELHENHREDVTTHPARPNVLSDMEYEETDPSESDEGSPVQEKSDDAFKGPKLKRGADLLGPQKPPNKFTLETYTNVEGPPYICRTCGAVLGSAIGHKRHETQNRCSWCPECNKYFLTRPALSEHQHVAHPVEPSSHNKHKQSHEQVETRPILEKGLREQQTSGNESSMSNLSSSAPISKQQQNIANVVTNHETRGLSCRICGKTYKQAGFLKNHINEHPNSLDQPSERGVKRGDKDNRPVMKEYTTSKARQVQDQVISDGENELSDTNEVLTKVARKSHKSKGPSDSTITHPETFHNGSETPHGALKHKRSMSDHSPKHHRPSHSKEMDDNSFEASIKRRKREHRTSNQQRPSTPAEILNTGGSENMSVGDQPPLCDESVTRSRGRPRKEQNRDESYDPGY